MEYRIIARTGHGFSVFVDGRLYATFSVWDDAFAVVNWLASGGATVDVSALPMFADPGRL